jgi:hypothetical protein
MCGRGAHIGLFNLTYSKRRTRHLDRNDLNTLSRSSSSDLVSLSSFLRSNSAFSPVRLKIGSQLFFLRYGAPFWNDGQVLLVIRRCRVLIYFFLS